MLVLLLGFFFCLMISVHCRNMFKKTTEIPYTHNEERPLGKSNSQRDSEREKRGEAVSNLPDRLVRMDGRMERWGDGKKINFTKSYIG